MIWLRLARFVILVFVFLLAATSAWAAVTDR